MTNDTPDLIDEIDPTPVPPLQEETREILYDGPSGRLDKVLSDIWPDLSRARWQSLIKDGHIKLAGQAATSPKQKVAAGVILEATIPAPIPALPQPENIPLTVLYEDSDVIVIDKPAGLVVHPAAGNPTGTLVNALLHHCQGSLSGIGGELRPGIVHRLDKDTSGVMIAAKNDHAHQQLSAQFAAHRVHRIYSALVWGKTSHPEGRIEGNIGRHPTHRQKMAVVQSGGKPAVTHYKRLQTITPKKLPIVTFISCKLETGRTHQIRVHMTNIGHPLLGDPVYTSRYYQNISLLSEVGTDFVPFKRQALHAGELGFNHPRTDTELRFDSELPNDFKNLIKFLEKS